MEDDDGDGFESDGPDSPSQSALVKVSWLVDSYLAEIAPEPNLKLSKFIAVHDGLYRSIDVYLKVCFQFWEGGTRGDELIGKIWERSIAGET